MLLTAVTIISLAGYILIQDEEKIVDVTQYAFDKFTNSEMNEETSSILPNASIKFLKSDIDLGTIKQGVAKEAIFTFTNTGDFPMMIYDIKTSCGCTGVEWPKKQIKKDESGQVNVIFDAKVTGRFFKTITMYCNTIEGSVILKIRGNVVY